MFAFRESIPQKTLVCHPLSYRQSDPQVSSCHGNPLVALPASARSGTLIHHGLATVRIYLTLVRLNIMSSPE